MLQTLCERLLLTFVLTLFTEQLTMYFHIQTTGRDI